MSKRITLYLIKLALFCIGFCAVGLELKAQEALYSVVDFKPATIFGEEREYLSLSSPSSPTSSPSLYKANAYLYEPSSISLSSYSTEQEDNWSFANVYKPPGSDSLASMDKSKLSFAERNSGAFKSKKKGGHRSAGIAALCSSLVPGLGQFYNGQWYKPPVIYAGAVVIGYFMDVNLKEKRVYQKEINARFKQDSLALNPSLSGYTKENLLELRNYYEQTFELTIIIAGVVYLLNIVDAIVYAHLFDFNVSPNLSMKIEPYARPRYNMQDKSFPLDMGFKICLTLK